MASPATASSSDPPAAASTLSILPSPSIQMARALSDLGVDQVSSSSPLDLYKQQLASGSAEAAVDAMKRTTVVAIVLGEQVAVSELVPYLEGLVLSASGGATPAPSALVPAAATAIVSDELLLLLGQELIKLTQFLGAAHLLQFLPLLERLASMEETVVRDQAVVVLQQVCEMSGAAAKGVVSKQDVMQWVGLCKRLAGADWFTAKVSACGVTAPMFTVSRDVELLTMFRDGLARDDTPMVRRAAAQHLGAVLKAAGYQHRDAVAAALPVLVRDEQDSVRLLAVAALAAAGPTFGQAPSFTVPQWLPLVKEGSTDMSWRVRHNLAKHFSEVVNSLGIQGNPKYMAEQNLVMACFVSLLTDQEAEVRAAAVSHFARMVAWGGQALFEAHLQPLLPALADDVVMEVRSKCALALMDAADGGTLDDSLILQAFGPFLEAFLQDEFHEVQLQVLTNLHKIARLLPGLTGVVTSLLQMSKASNWRVRQAVAQLLPHLAEARGLEFFSVLLESVWLTLLLDSVAQVRQAIVQGMGLLVKVAGQEWIQQTLLPQHVRIYNANSSSYLVRITILQSHIETAVSTQSGPLWESLVLQILRGLSDKVANVRMVAADGLARMVEEGDSAIVQAQIRPALQKRVQEDPDIDCRHACERALERVK